MSRPAAAATPQPQRLTYRPREVADLLGLPLSTLHDLLRRGLLEHVRLGGRSIVELKNGIQRRRRGIVLIPAAAVQRLLDAHRIPARDGR